MKDAKHSANPVQATPDCVPLFCLSNLISARLTKTFKHRRRINRLLASLLAALVAGCATTDPVDRLAARLSAAGETDGRFTPIQLPVSASPEELTAKALGSVANYKIIKVRPVQINHIISTAVMVDLQSEGQQIVLLHYIGETRGWWTRVYDVR